MSKLKVDTSELNNQLKESTKEGLKDILKNINDGDFCTLLTQLLDEKGMKKADVIKRTTLDRNYAYQIFSGTKQATKDKVIQLCLAMTCNLATTNRLLILSNNSPLYSKVKRDAIIIFAINNSYTVMQTDSTLIDHGCEALI